MPSAGRYLLDSDVLIAAKNLYYNPSYCEAFWDWIVAGHTANRLFSIDKVRDELLSGDKDDPLYEWAQNRDLDSFFLSSKASATKWAQLATWAKSKPFLPAAQAKFLNVDSADAWLVAYAAHQGNFIIVTNEVSAPESKRSIKLPDAAAALGISTVPLFDLLSASAHKNFIFK